MSNDAPLESWVRALVRAKRNYEQTLAACRRAGTDISAFTFAEAVFPYANTSGFPPPNEAPVGTLNLELLDPWLVIGGNEKGHRRSPTETPEALYEALDALNEDQRSSHGNLARYVRLGPLPIFVAHEGKNRVPLFQDAGRHLAAWVGVRPFPDPKHLVLTRIWPSSVYWLECRDREFWHRGREALDARGYPVLFPEALVPLYQAYGVRLRHSVGRAQAAYEQQLNTLGD